MEGNITNEDELTPAEAMAEIMAIAGQIQQEGAVTDEKDEIQNVIAKLQSGIVTPAGAIEEARRIHNNRGSDH